MAKAEAPKISPWGIFFRFIGGIFRWTIAGLTAWYRDGELLASNERAARWTMRDRLERYWSVIFYALLLLWGSSIDLALPWVEDPIWARALGVIVLTLGGVFVSVITARRIVVAVTHDPWTAREMWTDKVHLSAILFVFVLTPVVMYDDSLPIPSEWFTAGFPILTGIVCGAWAASLILVDHRSKAKLLGAVKTAFGGSETEWNRARFVARGKVVTVRHVPAAAFTDLRASDAKLAAVAPGWQIDEGRTSAEASRVTLVSTTEETEANRAIVVASEGLVISASTLEMDAGKRPRKVRYNLAPGTGQSAYPRVDALAQKDGLRVTSWQWSSGYAIAERLDADVAQARDVIADALKVQPHEIEIKVVRAEDEPRFESITIVRAPLIALDEDKRLETWRLTTRMLPYGTTGWTVEEGAQTVLTWGPTREVPGLVPGADLLPEVISPDEWSRIPLGIDSAGAISVLDLKAGPHSLVVGPTGSGKSVSTRLLILGALARGFQIVYIDPVKRGAGLRDMEPWTRGMYTTSAVEAAEVLTAVYAEVTRRVDAIEDARVEDWRSLDGIQPMLVILDEFVGLVRPEVKPTDKNGDAYAEWEEKATAQGQITTLVSKIAAEARSAGVFLALATQRPDTTYIPGEARSNLGSVVLLVSPNKAPARTTLGMVFDADEIEDAKVEVKDLHGSTPGFALVANEGGGLRGIRVGYIEPDQPAAILTALGVPLGDLIVPKHERKRGAEEEPEEVMPWDVQFDEPLPAPEIDLPADIDFDASGFNLDDLLPE